MLPRFSKLIWPAASHSCTLCLSTGKIGDNKGGHFATQETLENNVKSKIYIKRKNEMIEQGIYRANIFEGNFLGYAFVNNSLKERKCWQNILIIFLGQKIITRLACYHIVIFLISLMVII